MTEQLDILTAIAYEEGRPILEVIDEAAAAELPLTEASQLAELPGESFEDIFRDA